MQSGRQLLDAERKRQDYGRHLNPVRLDRALRVMRSPVLDLGCASGKYVRAFREREFEAFGLDLLPPEEPPFWSGGGFVNGDCARLPFRDATFATVTAFELFEHLERPELALREVARVLRGHLVLSVPDATRSPAHEPSGFTFHHWLDRTHRQAFTPDALRELLEASGFSVLSLEPMNPVRPEILVLDQYALPSKLRSLLLRALLRLPGRRTRYMTMIAVALREPR